MSVPRNATSIDQLFDLEEQERNGDKYSHFMKGNVPNHAMLNPVQYYNKNDIAQIHNMENQMELQERNFRDMHYPHIPPKTTEQYCDCTIHCKDILKHIKNCEICMKFYNTDKSIYIILLILFGLVIIILLKKVMEK